MLNATILKMKLISLSSKKQTLVVEDIKKPKRTKFSKLSFLKGQKLLKMMHFFIIYYIA